MYLGSQGGAHDWVRQAMAVTINRGAMRRGRVMRRQQRRAVEVCRLKKYLMSVSYVRRESNEPDAPAASCCNFISVRR